jgi:glucokinase
MLIAGDVGGTKTDLAIFSSEAGPHSPFAQAQVRSADYPNLQKIVTEFLAKVNKPVDRACSAVPGPVIEGRVKTTNLPWVIEESALAQELNLDAGSVHLINDLEAIARAVSILRPSDVETINAGQPVPKGAIAVIAPDTGLGESFLTWDGTGYVAHSSEGGHSDFAPTDERQIHLLEYMLKQFDHVSFEHVCSGIGIPHLYRYLRDVEHLPEDPGVAKLIDSARDPSFVIISQAMDPANACKLCAATIDLCISILAAEAGNLAVKVLSTGGVYLAGGVATRVLRVIKEPGFMERFKRKGRFAEPMGARPRPRCRYASCVSRSSCVRIGDSLEKFVAMLDSPAAPAEQKKLAVTRRQCFSSRRAVSRSNRSENSEIHDSDDSSHLVLSARREIYGELGDVAGFNADHLDPLVIRKIRHGMRFLHPRIPHDSRA